MRQIIVNQEFLNSVASGKAKQTIRFWKRRHNINTGDTVKLFNYRTGMFVRIIEVYAKPIDKLTNEEAKRSGYQSAKKLKMKLYEIYREYDKTCTVLRFEPLGVN